MSRLTKRKPSNILRPKRYSAPPWSIHIHTPLSPHLNDSPVTHPMGHVGGRARAGGRVSALCSGICCAWAAGSGKAEKVVGAATNLIVCILRPHLPQKAGRPGGTAVFTTAQYIRPCLTHQILEPRPAKIIALRLPFLQASIGLFKFVCCWLMFNSVEKQVSLGL